MTGEIVLQCEHGLTEIFCEPCQAKDVRPDGPCTRANYEGTCPLCEGPIEIGDLIFMRDGQWIDEDCVREDDDAER